MFPYGLPIKINKPIKLDAPLKTIRVVMPTTSNTTVTVLQDAEDPTRLIARFETVYDGAQLTQRALREQIGMVRSIYSRRIKAEPDKQMDHEAWVNEMIRKLKSKLSASRADRATLVIHRDTGWPVSFQAENVELFQGLTESSTTTKSVVRQSVDVRFEKQ